MKNIYNIYGNDFFVCECFASPSELNAPPLCVNYLTMCQLFDGIYENAICENANVKMLLLDMVGLPVVLSSPPRLRFFILFYPPLTLEATKYAGCRGFKAKCQLFDVIVSY